MSPQSHIYVQQAPATGASLTSRISPAVGRVQFSPSKKSTASSSSIQQPEFIPDSHWLSHRPSASPASKFKKRKGKVKNVGQSVAGGTSGSGGVRLLDRISGLNVDDGVEAMDDGLQVSSRPEPPASRQEETAKESATLATTLSIPAEESNAASVVMPPQPKPCSSTCETQADSSLKSTEGSTTNDLHKNGIVSGNPDISTPVQSTTAPATDSRELPINHAAPELETCPSPPIPQQPTIHERARRLLGPLVLQNARLRCGYKQMDVDNMADEALESISDEKCLEFMKMAKEVGEQLVERKKQCRMNGTNGHNAGSERCDSGKSISGTNSHCDSEGKTLLQRYDSQGTISDPHSMRDLPKAPRAMIRQANAIKKHSFMSIKQEEAEYSKIRNEDSPGRRGRSQSPERRLENDWTSKRRGLSTDRYRSRSPECSYRRSNSPRTPRSTRRRSYSPDVWRSNKRRKLSAERYRSKSPLSSYGPLSPLSRTRQRDRSVPRRGSYSPDMESSRRGRSYSYEESPGVDRRYRSRSPPPHLRHLHQLPGRSRSFRSPPPYAKTYVPTNTSPAGSERNPTFGQRTLQDMETTFPSGNLPPSGSTTPSRATGQIPIPMDPEFFIQTPQVLGIVDPASNGGIVSSMVDQSVTNGSPDIAAGLHQTLPIPQDSIHQYPQHPPPKQTKCPVPGFWAVRLGSSHADILDVSFEIEDHVLSATNSEASATVTIQLVCLPTADVNAMYSKLAPDASLETIITAFRGIQIRWPPKGQLVMEVNTQEDWGFRFLPRHMDRDDAPIDVTQHVRPGTNLMKFIQLVDLSDFMFLVYVSNIGPQPKLKADIVDDNTIWEDYLTKWTEKLNLNISGVGRSGPFQRLSEAVVSVAPS